jgi:hypothetical protein
MTAIRRAVDSDISFISSNHFYFAPLQISAAKSADKEHEHVLLNIMRNGPPQALRLPTSSSQSRVP